MTEDGGPPLLTITPLPSPFRADGAPTILSNLFHTKQIQLSFLPPLTPVPNVDFVACYDTHLLCEHPHSKDFSVMALNAPFGWGKAARTRIIKDNQLG